MDGRWQHAERSNLKPMRSPMRFDSGAPVRCGVKQSDRAERVHAQHVLSARIERAIDGCFEVDQVIDIGIGADAADMRRKATVDDWRGSKPGAERRDCVGKTPGRCCIPRILDSRVVVCRDAVGNVELADAR